MRLDHLLSTEFSGPCSGAVVCPMPGMVSGVRGAGVEEIVGCRAVFVRGSGVGHAFGFPDRHVLLFGGSVFPVPGGFRPWDWVPVVGGRRCGGGLRTG